LRAAGTPITSRLHLPGAPCLRRVHHALPLPARPLPSPSPGTAIFRAESSAALLRLFARARGAHATPRHGRGRKRVRGVVRRVQRFKSPRDTRGEYEPTPPFRVIPRAPLIGARFGATEHAPMLLIFHLSLSLPRARARLGFIYLRLYIRVIGPTVDRCPSSMGPIRK